MVLCQQTNSRFTTLLSQHLTMRMLSWFTLKSVLINSFLSYWYFSYWKGWCHCQGDTSMNSNIRFLRYHEESHFDQLMITCWTTISEVLQACRHKDETLVFTPICMYIPRTCSVSVVVFTDFPSFCTLQVCLFWYFLQHFISNRLSEIQVRYIVTPFYWVFLKVFIEFISCWFKCCFFSTNTVSFSAVCFVNLPYVAGPSSPVSSGSDVPSKSTLIWSTPSSSKSSSSLL